MKKSNKEIDRRQFFKSGAIAIGGLGAVGLGVNYLKNKQTESGELLLRPPGAVKEEDFIYGCIKCGLCVQICPIEAVKLAGITDGLSYGTPYIDPMKQACDFSCDAMQCVETCPTAALDFISFKKAGENAMIDYEKHHTPDEKGYNPIAIQSKAMKANTKMGIAKINMSTCFAGKGKGFKGSPRPEAFEGVYRSPNPKRKELKASPVFEHSFNRDICDLCVTECPIGETAIVMEKTNHDGQTKYEPKILDGCTGCGVCVMLCPSSEKTIIIEKA